MVVGHEHFDLGKKDWSRAVQIHVRTSPSSDSCSEEYHMTTSQATPIEKWKAWLARHAY